MKLATFTHDGATRIGVVTGEQVVDLATVAPGLPRDMVAFLAAGRAAIDDARRAETNVRGRVALADVRLRAPVPRPPKFLAIGLNYADHVKESGPPML